MKELIQALINQGVITATDIQRMTTLELLLSIIERVNELHGLTKEGLEAVQRLLDEGVQEEVIAIFDEWTQDGTFDRLINQSALKKVNDRIDETNAQLAKINCAYARDFDDLQLCVDFAIEHDINIIQLDGVIVVDKIVNLKSFKGVIDGRNATIKAKDNTTINKLLNLESSNNITFRDLTIDMSQSELTELNTPRCEIGIYMRNCRDIKLDNVKYINCRIGRPFYVSGTSSTNTSELDGSKRIYINDNKIYGITYDQIDEGCYPIISSDFYSGTNGGVYFSASNGVRLTNMSIDGNVSYQPTTSDIFITNLFAENCDRIAILNVENVHFLNCNLHNFYTRGYNFSPTCVNCTVKGGYVSGGDATQLATAYGCRNITFDSINLKPLNPYGEKCNLKSYYGCRDIIFNNINGIIHYDRGIYVRASDNITFSNINLKYNNRSCVNAVEIYPYFDDSTNYTVTSVILDNCRLEGNNGFKILNDKDNSSISVGAIKFNNTKLKCVDGSLMEQSSLKLGELDLIGMYVSTTSSAKPVIDSRVVHRFDNTNIGVTMISESNLSVTSQSIIQSFDLYYYAPNTEVGFIDNTRFPSVSLYKNGSRLTYGVDWFISGEISNEVMTNKIRLYDGLSIKEGDILTLVRHA